MSAPHSNSHSASSSSDDVSYLPFAPTLRKILMVMGVGFMLHDRLLRPAQVGVSSNTQG